MSLTWKDLYISVINSNKNIKTKYLDIIKCTSGSVEPGQILAIMGPSGGGKSTLLNALAGRIPPNSITQGSIKYNSKDRSVNNWYSEIGFVEQAVLLKEELTVKETFQYIYNFCHKSIKTNYVSFKNIQYKNEENINSSILSDKNLQQKKRIENCKCEDIIERVVNDLNLSNVINNSIQKLSGGECKRVSIGTALMRNPSILFLDEPTSGLDTLSALKICRILKKMAVEQNKTIVLTIHQPSNEIFNFFNQLLLLSDGNVIYYGLVMNVECFLREKGIVKREQATIPEFIVEICCNEFKEENPELFYNEGSVFKENCVIKNKQVMKTKNDTYIDFNPSINHILLLFRRMLVIQKNKKFEFFKAQFFKLCVYCLIIFFAYIASKKLSNFTQQKGFEDVNIADIMDESFILDSIKMIFVSTFVIMQVTSSITCNIDDINHVRAEISNGYYSIPSYYCSILAYQIFYELFASLFALIFYIFLFNKADFFIFKAFLFTPFITIPFGLFIGSFTESKQLVPILSSLFGTLSSIPPDIISNLIEKFGFDEKRKKNVFSYVSLLAMVISPYYYTAFLKYGLLSHRYEELNKGKMGYLEKLKKNMCYDERERQLLFINYMRISPYLLPFFLLLSTMFVLICGTFFAGIKNRPNMRMQTEKGENDKMELKKI